MFSKIISNAALMVMFLIGGTSYAAGDLEWNTDRPGSDYMNFDLPVDDPLMCKEACAGQPACKAAVYVPTGVQGVNARCWLKNNIPNATVRKGMISWVKPY